MNRTIRKTLTPISQKFKKLNQVELIKGGCNTDNRGDIGFNNHFYAIDIKRIYTIQNGSTNFLRAWQGHAIGRRWFSILKRSFETKLIQIDNWENSDKKPFVFSIVLSVKNFDILCVAKGYVNSTQSLEEDSKLLAMSD